MPTWIKGTQKKEEVPLPGPYSRGDKTQTGSLGPFSLAGDK